MTNIRKEDEQNNAGLCEYYPILPTLFTAELFWSCRTLFALYNTSWLSWLLSACPATEGSQESLGIISQTKDRESQSFLINKLRCSFYWALFPLSIYWNALKPQTSATTLCFSLGAVVSGEVLKGTSLTSIFSIDPNFHSLGAFLIYTHFEFKKRKNGICMREQNLTLSPPSPLFHTWYLQSSLWGHSKSSTELAWSP